MPPVPKPTKKDRLATTKKVKDDLKEYRRAQAAVAAYRDNQQCVICKFSMGRDTPMADVHHVYGRGKRAGDWREQAKNLMCVCRRCHPQPIKGDPGSSTDLAWVEDYLWMANGKPINPDFEVSND